MFECVDDHKIKKNVLFQHHSLLLGCITNKHALCVIDGVGHARPTRLLTIGGSFCVVFIAMVRAGHELHAVISWRKGKTRGWTLSEMMKKKKGWEEDDVPQVNCCSSISAHLSVQNSENLWMQVPFNPFE